jgi:hypothetical protein
MSHDANTRARNALAFYLRAAVVEGGSKILLLLLALVFAPQPAMTVLPFCGVPGCIDDDDDDDSGSS